MITISRVLRHVGIGSQLLAVLAMGACHSVSTPNDTINFDGPIDDRNVAKFETALENAPSGTVKWVEITSGGGDARAGFKFGRLVHDRGLSVRVRGYCNSACAESVFLAGRIKDVEPGSLVLFHGTASTMKRLHAAAGSDEGSLVFDPLAREEDQFLDTIGIKVDLTALAIRELKPICVLIDGRISADQINRYGYATQFAAYALPRRMVEELAGGPVDGYWPSNPNELAATLRGLPFNDKFTVAWADRPLPMRNQPHAAPILARCPSASRSEILDRPAKPS